MDLVCLGIILNMVFIFEPNVLKKEHRKEIHMILLFYYLTILNLFDAAVTWFGLKHSFITELNPLMDAIYQASPVLFFVIKSALSFFLLLFILFNHVPRSSLLKGVTVFAAIFYTAVATMHGYWLVQVF